MTSKYPDELKSNTFDSIEQNNGLRERYLLIVNEIFDLLNSDEVEKALEMIVILNHSSLDLAVVTHGLVEKRKAHITNN